MPVQSSVLDYKCLDCHVQLGKTIDFICHAHLADTGKGKPFQSKHTTLKRNDKNIAQAVPSGFRLVESERHRYRLGLDLGFSLMLNSNTSCQYLFTFWSKSF